MLTQTIITELSNSAGVSVLRFERARHARTGYILVRGAADEAWRWLSNTGSLPTAEWETIKNSALGLGYTAKYVK